MRFLPFAVVLALFHGLISSLVFAQTPYRFDIVAREGDTVGGLPISSLGTARINDNGQIAFSGSSGSTSAVWSTSGVLLAEGQSLGGGVNLPDFDRFNFALNNAGQVAVSGLSDSQGVFTSSGIAITAGSTIGGQTITGNFDNGLALADDGTPFFIADVGTVTTVFSASSVLAQEGQTIGGVTLNDIGSDGFNGLFAADDAGNAIFYNNVDIFDLTSQTAVVSTAGFALEQGSSFPTGPLAGQTIDFVAVNSFGLGVNGLGDIINEATVGGVGGLYSQNGLVIADGVIDGVDGEFSGGADINDSGSFVSSFSDFDTIDQGIVVDGSLVLTNLDTISGFDIQTLLFSNSLDLNNNGDFVFDAELIDPTTNTAFNAVVRATAVPEPGSLALLSLGSLLIMYRRSKFNRNKESV